MVLNYPVSIRIDVRIWPNHSPDLESIGHIWDMLGKILREHPNRHNNLGEMECLLVETWDNTDQHEIRRLISSMN